MLNIATSEDLDAICAEAKAYTDEKIAEIEPASPADGYDDSELRGRVEALEGEPDPAPYDDAPLKSRVAALEAEPGWTPYDDGPVKSRLTALESTPPATYNDTELRNRIVSLEARPVGGTGSAYVYETEVPLGVRTESTDDGKLAALANIIRNDTHKGVEIVFDKKKTYTFSQPLVGWDGLGIRGTHRPQDQGRGSMPVGNLVRIRTNGPWITWPAAPSDTYGIAIRKVSFDGVLSASLVQGGSSKVGWTGVFEDISAQNFGDLFGTESSKFWNTACSFRGFWNINNVQRTAFVLGGSDTKMLADQMLIDSPGNNLMADHDYLIRFQQQSKMNVTGYYITAERHSAILNTGSNDMVRIAASTIEGRNAGAPAFGCLIRNESNGELSYTDGWLSYAMASPSAVTLTKPGSSTRVDRGVVHATSGYVHLGNIEYQRATGVAESTPFAFYGATAKGRVRDIFGKGFSGKPVVQVLKAAGESDTTAAARVVCDDSVTMQFVTT